MLKNKTHIIKILENNFNPYQIENFENTLVQLRNCNLVKSIFLGGSICYKKEVKNGDIDLFCVINNIETFENLLLDFKKWNKEISAIIYQGIFPWTNKLYTIYFKNDFDFSIDIALISKELSAAFFWEPNGIILSDKHNFLATKIKKLHSKKILNKHPFLKKNPFSLALITIKKIYKNLGRGHLWNSLELLSILRRYIMQIIRLNVLQNENFLGRVDRDIEDVLPIKYKKILSKSIANYNFLDIAKKTLLLIETLFTLLNHMDNDTEKVAKKWLIEQIKYELIKFKKLVNA